MYWKHYLTLNWINETTNNLNLRKNNNNNPQRIFAVKFISNLCYIYWSTVHVEAKKNLITILNSIKVVFFSLLVCICSFNTSLISFYVFFVIKFFFFIYEIIISSDKKLHFRKINFNAFCVCARNSRRKTFCCCVFCKSDFFGFKFACFIVIGVSSQNWDLLKLLMILALNGFIVESFEFINLIR